MRSYVKALNWKFKKNQKRYSAIKYIVTLFLVAIAGSIQLYLKSYYQSALFIIFYPTVFYIVWIFGLRPALFAIFMSAYASLNYFGYSYHDHRALARAVTFCISSLFVTCIINSAIKSEKVQRKAKNKLLLEAYFRSKQLQKTLNEIEDLYNNAPCGYYTLDQSGNIITINNTVLSWLGYSREELLGKKLESILSSNGVTTYIDNLINSFKLGKEYNFELEFLRKDGTSLICFISGSTHLDLNSNSLHTRASSIDITDRIAARENLNMLSQAVEQSPISIEVTDWFGNILYVNKQFLIGSGYTKEEIIGKNPNILSSGKTSKETFSKMWNEIKNGRTWSGEFINLRKNGETFIEEVFMAPVFNLHGKISHFMALKNDITEKKLQEEMIRDQQKQLVVASRFTAIGEMASGIAHEINNPLTIIQAKAQSISKKLENENIDIDKIKIDIVKIISSITRITSIINGLKIYSSEINQDKMDCFSIRQILTSTLDLCGEKINSNGIKLIVDEFEDINIDCNQTQIIQILINLINNSFYAIKEKKEKWININVATFSDFVKIKIIDSGEGIPLEIADKIMQPFFTTKELGKGTGLGLSVSFGIAQNHSGQLYLDDDSKNTCFVLELPIHQVID